MARWQALSVQSRDTFWRSLQTLTATRIVIAIVLLLYLSFDTRGGGGQYLYAKTCIAYLAGAVLFGALTFYWRRRFMLQLGAQIALDLAVISLLYVSGGGVRSGCFRWPARRSWRRWCWRCFPLRW